MPTIPGQPFEFTQPRRARALVQQMRFLFALCSLVLRVSAPCPRCTDTDPVTTGSYSSVDPGTFQPTQNCYLAVPEVPEIFELLAGSWLYSAGGSNGWAPPTALHPLSHTP